MSSCSLDETQSEVTGSSSKAYSDADVVARQRNGECSRWDRTERETLTTSPKEVRSWKRHPLSTLQCTRGEEGVENLEWKEREGGAVKSPKEYDW